MVRGRFKGISTTYKTLKDGSKRTYYYHRATGKRLRGKPGNPDFILDYAAAESSLVDRHEGTFIKLVRDYTSSIEFEKHLAQSTKTEYRRMLTKAESEFGELPLSALEDSRVRKDFLDWRERVAKDSGAREADNRLSAISAMITWAVDRGQLRANHLKGFKRLHHSNRAEQIWLPEQIAAFMSVASMEMQRALIIALHTGQRQGDILRLSWTCYDGETITLRQGKAQRNGILPAPISVRCTETLRQTLDQIPRTSTLILATKSGRAFKKRYFAAKWKSAMIKAGIVGLRFHDLRGTAITMLAEAGNTVPQIASVTGHSLKTVNSIIEKYLARTPHLSDAAISNFENSPRTKFANQLQTVPPANVGKKQKTK